MKPSSHILYQKTQPQCENLKFGSSLFLPFWQSLTQLRKQITLVYLDARAGLIAYTKATSNSRTYCGLFILLVAAPLSAVGYQLFPKNTFDITWYYVNNFYLFMVLCPHISLLLTLTGVFLILPEHSKRGYFLILPAGYHIAKIIWLSLANSNDELNTVVPLSFLLIGVLFSCIWLFTFDWLMNLHFHKREGSNCRIYGIIDLNIEKELSDEVAMSALRKEREGLKKIIETV